MSSLLFSKIAFADLAPIYILLRFVQHNIPYKAPQYGVLSKQPLHSIATPNIE